MRGHDEFLQPPEVEEALLLLLHHGVSEVGTFRVLSDVHTKELEAFDPRLCGPVDMDGGVHPLLAPVVHHQLLGFVGVEGKFIFIFCFGWLTKMASKQRKLGFAVGSMSLVFSLDNDLAF